MAGTWKKALIDGISYNVMGDSDHDITGGDYDNTPINHSGGTGASKTRRNSGITGFTLYLSAQEAERLRQLQNKPIPPYYSIGGIDDQGNTYKALGFMNFTSYTQQSGTGTVELYPKSLGGFVLFAA